MGQPRTPGWRMILGEFKSAGIGWENAARIVQDRALDGALLAPSVLLGGEAFQ